MKPPPRNRRANGRALDNQRRLELTGDLKAELDRRLASYEASPSKIVTWEQLVRRVRKQRHGS